MWRDLKMMRFWMLVGALGLLAGCGSSVQGPVKNQPARAPGEQTLYDRVGGGGGIDAIVDRWIGRAIEDSRVNFGRQGHPHAWVADPDNLAQLKTYFSQYIGMLTDGPPVYEGRNLLTVHTGMNISEGEWLAFLDDLKKTLDDYQVPPDVQRDLLSRVAATRDVIVAK